jgi:hypothetical protein
MFQTPEFAAWIERQNLTYFNSQTAGVDLSIQSGHLPEFSDLKAS